MNNNTVEKEKIILKLKDFFKEKAEQYRVETALLYGSWAGGYPRRDSDIDIAVLFNSNFNNEEKMFNAICDIAYALEILLNKEANILVIHRDFRHPMLYYNAIIAGLPLFIKDADRYLDLKLEALYQMEDFQILGIPWQKQVARQLIGGLKYA